MAKNDVFISYRRADLELVEELARALHERYINVWLDRWDLVPGEPWQEGLENAITSARSAIVFVGAEGLGPWENEELRVLLSRLVKDPSFRVIPVLGPGAKPEDLPLFLQRLTFVDLRDFSAQGLERLARLIMASKRHEPAPPVVPRVFLCHAKEDEKRVEDLYFALGAAGLDPWYDKKKLAVGDRWETEIMRAIEQTDFFAACLSKAAVQKSGFIQKEIRTAVREFQRRPQDTAYFLPIRLEEFVLPRIKLDENSVLTDLQWIDVFDGDADAIRSLADGVWKQWARRREESEGQLRRDTPNLSAAPDGWRRR